jgi:hypothetical protein
MRFECLWMADDDIGDTIPELAFFRNLKGAHEWFHCECRSREDWGAPQSEKCGECVAWFGKKWQDSARFGRVWHGFPRDARDGILCLGECAPHGAGPNAAL